MGKRIVILMAILTLLCTGVVQGAAGAVTPTIIEGYLMELDPDSAEGSALVVEAYSGDLHRLSAGAAPLFSIDGVPVKWSDLKPGLEVIVATAGTQLLSLEAFSTPHPGYIAPGSRVVKGMVTGIDRDQITVKGDGGLEGQYSLAPFTIVTKGGQAMPFDVLYIGDRVLLYFDEVDSKLVSRMEIEGDSILVSSLYRGTLQLVNPLEGRLACSNMEAFHNGVWLPDKSALSLAYNIELPIYLSGCKVPPQNLKYYRGKTVYLLGKQIMGQEKVDRLILKGQAEYTYNGSLANYNSYTSEFEINNKNFLVGAGSVIIKDGRLQEKGVLQNGGSALVMADNWGERPIANIVYILDQGLNNSNLSQHHLYAGRIDLITEDSIWVRNAYTLHNHSWEKVGNQVQLYYGSDIRVYDAQEGKWLEPGELLAGPYAVDEDSEYSKERDLKDWYGYIYTDTDHIIALVVRPQRGTLDSQRVSTGTVTAAVNDSLIGWSITFGEGRDWSSHNKQWMLKQGALRLSTADALIIKNGQAVSPDQLKPGDRLYMLRDDFYVRFAIVK